MPDPDPASLSHAELLAKYIELRNGWISMLEELQMDWSAKYDAEHGPPDPNTLRCHFAPPSTMLISYVERRTAALQEAMVKLVAAAEEMQLERDKEWSDTLKVVLADLVTTWRDNHPDSEPTPRPNRLLEFYIGHRTTQLQHRITALTHQLYDRDEQMADRQIQIAALQKKLVEMAAELEAANEGIRNHRPL